MKESTVIITAELTFVIKDDEVSEGLERRPDEEIYTEMAKAIKSDSNADDVVVTSAKVFVMEK